MQKNRKKVTIALIIATFLASIEGTIVSTATASIANDLQGVSLVSWLFTVYLLTMTVTTPIYGKLADLYGRRLIFTLGIILFLSGSALCGLAQSMEQLIFFRALQGLGAGAVMPITTTIVGDIYPYEQRAKIYGMFSAIWGVSGVVAPLLGGFLVDYVSWHWIFYINLPFGVVSLILLRLYLVETIDRSQAKQIDYLGAITFTVAVTSLLLGILLGGTHLPWASIEIVALFIAGSLLFTLFLYVETRVPEPMLPLKLFRIPSVTYANLSGFLLSIILIGINIYLPIWIQGVYGYGATGAGLSLIPMSLGWMISSNLASFVLLRLGPKRTILIGFSLILTSAVGLSLLESTVSPLILIGIMLLMGFGFGMSMTVSIVLGQSGMGTALRGVASSSNSFLRTLGQTVGSAILGAMFNWWTRIQLKDNPGYTSGDIELILNVKSSEQLSRTMLFDLREILSSSIHTVFLCMCLFALFALCIGFKFPHQPPVEKK